MIHKLIGMDVYNVFGFFFFGVVFAFCFCWEMDFTFEEHTKTWQFLQNWKKRGRKTTEWNDYLNEWRTIFNYLNVPSIVNSMFTHLNVILTQANTLA